ncbi:hypothetical protein D3C75_1096900 [compost metagenome]
MDGQSAPVSASSAFSTALPSLKSSMRNAVFVENGPFLLRRFYLHSTCRTYPPDQPLGNNGI